MANYAKPQALDKNGLPHNNMPAPFKALATYDSENATVSSVITLTQDTTAVEVAANGGTAVVRWIATSDTQASVVSAASGANFDHVIPTGTYRRFVIPVETSVATNSVMGINRQQGLYQRLAYKTVGVASVLTTEY